ncbi:hypothetical protein RQM59_12165 [Flavobacteriaceae bacterium S356]|uniref:Outer membrane protein beta-barrel domain-containing protein n=1 Tax=Asprobacillus argus TaxID=3076534 RepID=A0ABU3LJ98_9FLAO|nr:hypothetical protein [Flavobacteriaceae bacterium S356]
MKKITVCMFLLATAFGMNAQEKENQKEVGIQFSSLNSFGLTYKSGTSKSLWRYNVLTAGVGSIDNDFENNNFDQRHDSFNISASIGKEYRKKIATNLEFRSGFDLSFGYSSYKTENGPTILNNFYQKRQAYSPGINAVIGLNYVINDKLVIGAEILPNIQYSFGEVERLDSGVIYKGDLREWNFGLNSNSARLTVAYRF